MTDKQKQHLLGYLGYYTGDIDGIYGPQTKAAVERFQKDFGGIVVDGLAGDETDKALRLAVAYGMPEKKQDAKPQAGTFWDEIKYFTRAEFRCPCGKCGGFPVEPDENLVRLADKVREHFGAPATVSSGVRCQAHNDELPGSAKNSYHLRGKAMDFCVQGVSGAKLLAYVKTLPVHYAYQINGSDFVHMDVN